MGSLITNTYESMKRKREIYKDYQNGMTNSNMIKKWRLSRQRLNKIINSVKKRDAENIPDWLDIRVWKKLQEHGITLEQASKMTDDELRKIKQFGDKRISLIRKM